MFGLHFWQALFEGQRWARRQLVEGLIVVAVVMLAVGWIVREWT